MNTCEVVTYGRDRGGTYYLAKRDTEIFYKQMQSGGSELNGRLSVDTRHVGTRTECKSSSSSATVSKPSPVKKQLTSGIICQ